MIWGRTVAENGKHLGIFLIVVLAALERMPACPLDGGAGGKVLTSRARSSKLEPIFKLKT